MSENRATYTTADLAKLEKQAKQEAATIALLDQIYKVGLPDPDREIMFHKTRKWRFDMVYRIKKIAIEVEGGIWSRGRHVRGVGYENDCEKYNEAQLAGWVVIRVTPGMIKSGLAIQQIERAFLQGNK